MRTFSWKVAGDRSVPEHAVQPGLINGSSSRAGCAPHEVISREEWGAGVSVRTSLMSTKRALTDGLLMDVRDLACYSARSHLQKCSVVLFSLVF